jgi:hypothetical protein
MGGPAGPLIAAIFYTYIRTIAATETIKVMLNIIPAWNLKDHVPLRAPIN